MGVDVQRNEPANLPPRIDLVIIVLEARWVPGPIWTGAENLAPKGIRPPDHAGRSESL